MMEELGQYAIGAFEWRKILSVTPEENKLKVFANAAQEFRSYVARGLDKVAAADALTEIASTHPFGQDVDEVQHIISEALEDVEVVPDYEEEKPKTNGHDKKPSAELIRLLMPFPIVEEKIPIRKWIMLGLLMRGQVTVVVAPSGAGKSLLTLQVGMACAQGISWGGWRLRKNGEKTGYRVLFINQEDDFFEVQRRVAAALRTMQPPHCLKIDQQAIKGNFLVAEADKIVIAKFDPRQKTIEPDKVLYPELIRLIKENDIDIVFVDPFAETFDADENSNNELKRAGALWREIARQTDCAICLVHHAKKYAAAMAGDVDAARGASALIGIARIVSTIFPMTEKEAELLLPPKERELKRPLMLRFDDAKANLNLITSVARWFRKVTIKLDNGSGDDQPADEVGALVPEKLEKATKNFLEADIIRFLESVDRGITDKNGKSTGEYYTFETRKARDHELSRYVGDYAMKFFEFRTMKETADYINELRDSKRLIEGPLYKSKRTRHLRTCCVSEFNELAKKPGEQEEAKLF
jgi:hypothetical protein